jgi:hypothetical protein
MVRVGSPSFFSRVGAVPFKANAERCHHIPKQRHRHELCGLRRGPAAAWQLDGLVHRQGARPGKPNRGRREAVSRAIPPWLLRRR